MKLARRLKRQSLVRRTFVLSLSMTRQMVGSTPTQTLAGIRWNTLSRDKKRNRGAVVASKPTEATFVSGKGTEFPFERLSYLQGATSHIWTQFKRKPPLPCRTQYFPVGLRQQQLKWGSNGRDGLLPHSCHQGAWTSGGYP